MVSQLPNKSDQEWWSEVNDKIREFAAQKAQRIVQILWQSSLNEAVMTEVKKLGDVNADELANKFAGAPGGAKKRKLGLAPIVPKGNPTKNAVYELDEIYLGLLRDYSKSIISHAQASTEFILKVSGNFLNVKAQTALNDFHSLYFGSGTGVNDTSAQVNREVDVMLKGIRDILDRNGNVDHTKIFEDQKEKMKRLSISGLQKQLEMIIALDEGIKDKLLPVLSSMQFEDMLSHRLAHIVYMWEKIINHLRDGENGELSSLIDELKIVPTSQAERRDFYNLVLGEEAPEGIDDKQSIFDILF